MDIERALRERGYDIDRRRILLDEPIKTLGTSTITIQLARDLQAAITLTVEPATDE